MHILDVALAAGLVLATLRPWTRWHGAIWAAAATVAVPVALAVAQIVLVGLRWQTILLHAAVVLVAGTGLYDAARPGARRRLLRTVVPLVLTVTGIVGLWALPVIELDPPGGELTVGTATFAVVDHDREERHGPDPGGPRRLAAQVWYPADEPQATAPTPWLEHAGSVSEGISEVWGIPRFALGHLAEIGANAVPGAPAAADRRYPVVVFSHGWSGFRHLHTPQIESLASNGYVVVALDHTHGALVSTFPDASTALLDPAMLPEDGDEDGYAEAARLLVETFARDVEVVVEGLEDHLPADVADAADTSRIALVGHSTGGGGAILACSRNRWCEAVVGYDPWVEPLPDDVIGTGLDVPLLSIRSEEWLDTANDARLRRLHAGSSAAEGRVAIAGVLHRDFTLVARFSPLTRVTGMAGATPPDELADLLDLWTVRFLDHHVRGKGVDPLRLRPSDERVTLASNGPRS